MIELGALLIREGSSEDHLDSLLTALFEDFGIDIHIDPFPFERNRKSLDAAFSDAKDRYAEKQLYLVHRDADNAGRAKRLSEIEKARESSGLESETVPVIPVKETEAWILHALHFQEFCEAIEVPQALVQGRLPKMSRIAEVNAKERLKEIHDVIYENRGSGRSRRRRKPAFTTSRSRWIAELSKPEWLEDCESFHNLRLDAERSLQELQLL